MGLGENVVIGRIPHGLRVPGHVHLQVVLVVHTGPYRGGQDGSHARLSPDGHGLEGGDLGVRLADGKGRRRRSLILVAVLQGSGVNVGGAGIYIVVVVQNVVHCPYQLLAEEGNGDLGTLVGLAARTGPDLHVLPEELLGLHRDNSLGQVNLVLSSHDHPQLGARHEFIRRISCSAPGFHAIKTNILGGNSGIKYSHLPGRVVSPVSLRYSGISGPVRADLHPVLCHNTVGYGGPGLIAKSYQFSILLQIELNIPLIRLLSQIVGVIGTVSGPVTMPISICISIHRVGGRPFISRTIIVTGRGGGRLGIRVIPGIIVRFYLLRGVQLHGIYRPAVMVFRLGNNDDLAVVVLRENSAGYVESAHRVHNAHQCSGLDQLCCQLLGGCALSVDLHIV